MQKQQGFSLVELVTTITLIAILAVVVLPRFFNSSSFSAYTLRDEFISELRRVQMMAMNNQDRCYGVEVSANDYRMMAYQTDCTSVIVSGNPQTLPSQSSLTLNGSNDFALLFDRHGVIAPTCSSGCIIKVVADESLDLTIESQGYIHGR
ncbi:type II secretion system GspH family protein [Shewanella sp. Isolate11]|nr:type II secretion system GspH family protein [Shewanella sp. Isolate11]